MAEAPAWASAPAEKPAWASAPAPASKTDALAASVPVPRSAEFEANAARKSAPETAQQILPKAAEGLIAPLEMAASIGTGLVTPVLHDMGFKKTADALQYEPRTKTARAGLEAASEFVDKTKLGGLGPAESALLAGLPKVPKPVGTMSKVAKMEPDFAAAVPRKPSVGAEPAVNELQRQREIVDAGKAGPSTGASSAVETQMGKAQGATGQFRDVLKNERGEVDAGAALKQIDSHLGGTAVESGERAALGRVKKAIDTAVKNAGGNVETIQTAGGPMMVKDGKLVPAKAGSGLPLEQIDAVRQAIRTELDRVDGAGKPLSADTQRRLMDVQNALLAKAPESYRKAIGGMAETRAGLDPFKAEGSVRTAVTGDPTQFATWSPADKAAKIADVFSGNQPSGRVMSELVRDTQHDPRALQSVREAFVNWLVPEHSLSEKPSPKAFVDNWSKHREAAVSSGLMTPEHAADFDRVMASVRAAHQAEPGMLKRSASGIAYILGAATANKGYAASRAVDMLTKDGSRAVRTEDALMNGLIKLSADPETARLLNAPPTPANIQKITVMLPADVAAYVAPAAAREEDQRARRRHDPLSMRPTGF